jgi:hypothetical protein
MVMKQLLIILLTILTFNVYGQIVVEKASIHKISWRDNVIIEEKTYPRPSSYSITDTTLIVGIVKYEIDASVVTDTTITYSVKETPYKLFVFKKEDESLTQKNLKYFDRGLVTWYIYKPITTFEL